MNILGAYRNVAEYISTGSQDEQLFKRLSRKFNIDNVPNNTGLTIPPLIDSLNQIKLSNNHLSINAGEKLYRIYTKGGTYWVIELNIENELPYFIVDSIFNTVGIDMIFKDYQEISLEGDFSDYFKLYIPTKDQVNVLSVIGPDLMQKIYEFWDEIDLIVAGKKAWLVMRNGWPIDQKVETMLNAGSIIAEELKHRARTYKP